MKLVAIGLFVALVLAACGGNSSSELEDALERIEELEAEAREDESTATSSTTSPPPSTTTEPPPSTTTEPPPSLEDLVETIAADVRSGDCTPGDELLEQYGSELLAAASAQSSDGNSMMMCDLLREVDNWLEVNDRRVKLYLAGTTPPSTPDCDAESGEASLEAFPALYSVLDSRLVYCVSVKADGDTVTFSSRQSNERTATPQGALSFRTKSSDWIGAGPSCTVTTNQVVVGGLFLDYWDFEKCALHIFLGNVDYQDLALRLDFLTDPVGYKDSAAPVAGVYHCPEECLPDDSDVEIVEAHDGFISDRSAGEYDGQELFDLDIALSGLDSALFFYGKADTAIDFNQSFVAVSYLIDSEAVIRSFLTLPLAMVLTSGLDDSYSLLDQGSLNESIPWRNRYVQDGITCDDWNLDAIERGSVTPGRPCMMVTMKVFQFDSSTGPCSFLAQIARSGAEMAYPENLQELVWIDGYSDRVRGSCLIDEKVDNGDIAYGQLEPSGTYSYVNGFGATATVPKFDALRVTEYWED